VSSHVQLEKKAASAKAPRSHESARKGVRQVEVGTTHYPWRAFMAFVSAASGNPERQRTRLRRALFAHETKPEPRARGIAAHVPQLVGDKDDADCLEGFHRQGH
jgi:hypothetical protein